MKNHLESSIKNGLAILPIMGSKLLAAMPNVVQKAPLQQVLNYVFREELGTGELEFLAGRILRLEVTDLHHCWYIGLIQGSLKIIEGPHFDVEFKGQLNDFIRLSAGRADPDQLFFNRRLAIAGDTELGLEIKSCLENLDPQNLPKPLHWLSQSHCNLLEKYGFDL
ncbi:ubiquinone anaerobic biosynthesis accessory factor UbiT [Pseudoalteromonas sp. T1lg75]|uniref:ubiquinone anaerobic biosynthesis accessory factor UbiT n=1 Tax=Pseudoalteromonas sp. T1lg75 TaxID=2077102 RepID=UPI000CF681F1|nr:SCP2 sterol-binding domain-containing protein [Pseudoalteromonas sp. T1lg75]